MIDWDSFDEEAFQRARRERLRIIRWTVRVVLTPPMLLLLWANESEGDTVYRVAAVVLALIYIVAYWWYTSRPAARSWADDWLDEKMRKYAEEDRLALRQEHRPLFSRRPFADPGPPN